MLKKLFGFGKKEEKLTDQNEVLTESEELVDANDSGNTQEGTNTQESTDINGIVDTEAINDTETINDTEEKTNIIQESEQMQENMQESIQPQKEPKGWFGWRTKDLSEQEFDKSVSQNNEWNENDIKNHELNQPVPQEEATSFEKTNASEYSAAEQGDSSIEHIENQDLSKNYSNSHELIDPQKLDQVNKDAESLNVDDIEQKDEPIFAQTGIQGEETDSLIIQEDNAIEDQESLNVAEEEPEQELGFFAKIKKGLTKTSQNFTQKINLLFSGYTKIDDEIFDELEELLILGDLGFDTAMSISNELRKRATEKKIEDVSVLETELENIIEEILVEAAPEITEEKYPQIIVVVGVNGVGKTTSIGKIAQQIKNEGKSVMLAAGDTFRAAAADQLSIWAQRADVPIIRSNEGADPSSVIYDAIKSAQSKNIDVLICDTAGRLHNKKNLMLELEKIFRIVTREYPEAQKEVYLVIDATTGQNAINQAQTFKEVAPITGIILTKLDGTAKGGVVIGLSKELNIPIKYVGVGEKINDLQKFNSREFARALFYKK